MKRSTHSSNTAGKFLSSKVTRLLLLLLLTWPATGLHAHGVDVAVKESPPAILVKAGYSGGSALKNTEIVIRFETEKTARAIFQRAQTDMNGYFSFTPHLPGTWIISVDDGMGHMGEEEITVTEEFFKQSASTGNSGSKRTSLLANSTCCYLLKILSAVLLILSITLILSRTKRKQELKDKGE